MSTILADSKARGALRGFLLTGMLTGILGSLMVAWRYQLDRDPRVVGLHFLAFNSAVLVSAAVTQLLLQRFSIQRFCLSACVVACLGFGELAFAVPPRHSSLRILGVAMLGAAAGILLTALLHFVRPYYDEHAASTINSCGLMFGLGSLIVTLIVGGTYYLYSVQVETVVLALIPLAMFLSLLRQESLAAVVSPTDDRNRLRSSLRDLRSMAAILFSLLLFFQFGNEWALAGWLPLFLIHRLGFSPESAIFVLALYFGALIAGRLIAQVILARVSHAKLLFASIVAAMLGYLVLSLTSTLLGASLATLVTGLAFAPIHALVAEKIGRRFDYEPGFFNSIFSLAVTGGMLVPWLLGFVAYYLGMQYVLIVPAFCSIAVLIVMLLIMLEAKLMKGDGDPPTTPSRSGVSVSTATGG
jgi:MFS transporter, FHS family, glucose/mannose:H+ symporter